VRKCSGSGAHPSTTRQMVGSDQLDMYRRRQSTPFTVTNPLVETPLTPNGSRPASVASADSETFREPSGATATPKPAGATLSQNPAYTGAGAITLDSNPEYGTVDEEDFMTSNAVYESSTDDPTVVGAVDAGEVSYGMPPATDGVNYQVPERAASAGQAQEVNYAVPEFSAQRKAGRANSTASMRSRLESVESSSGETPVYQSAEFALKSMMRSGGGYDSQIYGNAASITQSVVIDASRVVLGNVLDSGQFGEVIVGVLKGGASGRDADAKVAVKKIKGGSIPASHLLAFEAEMGMMAQLSHPNVLRLLAVVPDPLMIVMELVSEKSVKSYIQDRGYSHTNPIPWPTLLTFATQAAKGLHYLTDRGVIHRDIAARNMLLNVDSSTKFSIKVADFGLSKVVAQQVYLSKSEEAALPIPTRWTALEALYKGSWSGKSDVWSWGVMVWELTTHCQFPYTLLFDDRLNVKLIGKGLRLHQAALVPNDLYALLNVCWATKPEKRPDFRSVVARLTELTAGLTADVNVPKDYDTVPFEGLEGELGAKGKVRPVMQFTLPAAPIFKPTDGGGDALSADLFFEVPSEGEDPCYVGVDSAFKNELKAAGPIVQRVVESSRVVLLPIGDQDLLPRTVNYVRRRSEQKAERVLYALPPRARSTSTLPRRAVFAEPTAPKPRITPLAAKGATYGNSGVDMERYQNAEVLAAAAALPVASVEAMRFWAEQGLTRESAEKIVSKYPRGTFVIRRSATAAMGVVFAMTMHLGSGKALCKHYRMPSEGDNLDAPLEMLDSVNGNKSFANAYELVKYYQVILPGQKRSLPCRLGDPAPVPT